MLTKVKRAIRKIKARIPGEVPRTEAGLNLWIDDVLDLTGIPKNGSTRHALAAQLMHLPERVTTVPKQFFVKTLQRAIINQCAFNIMEDVKAQDKASREQAKADGPAEALVSKA